MVRAEVRAVLGGLREDFGLLDRAVLGAVLTILVITGLVAWFSPPNTWDSLIYHMSRVAHWAQERGARPFATGIEVQNSRPPWAEFAVLHLYVLAGGDRLANFVSWFAMLGSLVGVAEIAGRLGAKRRGQTLAVLFAATLPMGISQASSTMTDYVVAFWIVCVWVETLALQEPPGHWASAVMAGLAAGLALLSKPTAAAYLVPWAVYISVVTWRQLGLFRAIPRGAVVVGLAVVLNAGFALRNISLYGSVFNPNEVALHRGPLGSPRLVVSNLLRNASLHAGTPSPHVNKVLARAVLLVHEALGVEVNDPRTTSAGRFRISLPSTHEDLAGNPLHALLGLALAGAYFLERKRYRGLRGGYAAAVAGSFLMLSVLFKWQIFGSRYHLAFFVLGAPLVGRVLEEVRARRLTWAVVTLLFLSAGPWLLSINSRPLVPLPGRAYVGSILREPRERLYFANGTYLMGPVTEISGAVRRAGCGQVGLMLGGNSPEYLFWVSLGAPEAVRLEWIVAGTPSARFADPAFQPCAIVCERCPEDWSELRGLKRTLYRGGFALFQP